MVSCMMNGWGLRWTTYLVNSRRTDNTERISYEAVRAAFKHFKGKFIKRPTQKAPIKHRGTVVPELDNRKGRRKDAVRSQLTDKLTPEALAGLEEQLAASVGMSGPPGGC